MHVPLFVLTLSLYAGYRKRQKHIRSLVDNGEVLLSEDRKADVIFHYFDEVLGSSPSRMNSINLDILELPHVDPSGLGARFTEDEVWTVICALPPDKLPGPHRFTTRFLQVCWDLIKLDVMATLDTFWRLDTRDFHSANEALVMLLPKSPEASTIKDYRPISLIHLVGKLIAKILANRLAPRLGSLVHNNQSAFIKGRSIHDKFIKGRSIHDNFRFVHASARLLHVHRKPAILFKAEILKAFDSVAWSFLLEPLMHMGFPNAWIN
jgi:hypothetical protein